MPRAAANTAPSLRASFGLGAVVRVSDAVRIVGGDPVLVRAWLYRIGAVRVGPTGERVWLADLRDAMPVVASAASASVRTAPAEDLDYEPMYTRR